jgi:hypothetical protein
MSCNPVPEDRKVLRAQFTAQADGELFLYVNDAVLAIPGLTSIFMDNNSGTGEIRVRPVGVDEK